jgi:hypothetical protein
MSWYYLAKEFYDYADDIEGVNIHYVCTPTSGVADWENQRATRFMPLVHSSPSPLSSFSTALPTDRVTSPSPLRLRKKILKLPQRMLDPQSSTLTNRYSLHHYFEIFQDGHRHYSPLYTEEIVTDAAAQPAVPNMDSEKRSVPLLTTVDINVKESEE